MNEEILNAVNEEVVQPQYEGAEDATASQEITTPDYNNMSDEEFANYLNSVQNDVEQTESEVQAQPETEVQEETGVTEPAQVDNKPFKSFATQEDYQGEIDRIIGERLKKNRESMNTLEGLKELSQVFYGGEDGDSALAQLVEDLQSQNAEKRGVSVEVYKQQTQDSIDARKYREQQQQATDRQSRIAEVQQKWQSESTELKKIVPDFDFNTAMQNKTFYKNIVEGMSVSNAYLASRQAEAPARPPQRKAIPQNGTMQSSTTGKVEANPASMSDADFMRYINKIQMKE